MNSNGNSKPEKKREKSCTQLPVVCLVYRSYTSFSELLPLLAASLIPLVKVGDIVQEVDTESMTILNAVTFIGPLTSTTFEASAAFEVRSPKRLQVRPYPV